MRYLALTLTFLCVAISFASTTTIAEPTSNNDKTTNGALLESYPAEKVSEHIYVIHGPLEAPNPKNKGFMNNPAFIVTKDSVAVIDPGSSVQVGRAVLEKVRKTTDKPISHVFNTHIHGDHWLANQAFFEENPDVKIYAHPKMIEAAKAGDAKQWVELMLKLTENATKGTEAVIPAEALTDGEIIKVGDISIKTHLSEYAHTKTDAMFEVMEDKLLFTGDNVTNKRIPRMGDGSFRGSIATIDKALTLDIEKAVPGHGPTGGKEILESYKNYLSTIYESVKTLREEGLEDFEMKEKIVAKLADYKDWSGFDEEIGKHISLAVLEAEQAEFE